MSAQRRLFVAASCVVSALVCPGPAIAAAPWSTPQTIGGNCCSEQQLVALPGGGVALAGDTGISLVAPPGATPSFTQSVGFTGEFSPTGALGPLALAGGGQTVITMIATGPETIAALGTIGTAETLSAESGQAGQTLTPTPTLHLPQAFVVASTNDAILVRRCTDDCGGPSDLAVVRRHGAVWARRVRSRSRAPRSAAGR